MCCGGIPAQLRLVGVKTTGWILSYGLDFFIFYCIPDASIALSSVCGEGEGGSKKQYLIKRNS